MLNIQMTTSPDLDRLFSKGITFPSSELESVGRALKERIVNRTLSGRDAEGRFFKAYSPSYARRRRKQGKKGKPDLFFSGRMLGSVTVECSSLGVKVTMPPQEKLKARRNQALGRVFFALSAEDIAFARSEVEKIVAAHLEGAA